jgi:hypothetical protein
MWSRFERCSEAEELNLCQKGRSIRSSGRFYNVREYNPFSRIFDPHIGIYTNLCK